MEFLLCVSHPNDFHLSALVNQGIKITMADLGAVHYSLSVELFQMTSSPLSDTQLHTHRNMETSLRVDLTLIK